MIKNILTCVAGSLILALLMYIVIVLGISFVQSGALFLNPFEWNPIGRLFMYICWIMGSITGTIIYFHNKGD